jgi:hypothetical protein
MIPLSWRRKLTPSPNPRRALRRRVLPALEVLEDRLAPANLTVNSVADNTTADTSLTLREAVLLVDAGGNATTAVGRALTTGESGQITGTFGSNDTILFDPSLAGKTITLSITGDDTVGPSALPVTTALSIDGPSGGSGVTLSGGGRLELTPVLRVGCRQSDLAKPHPE